MPEMLSKLFVWGLSGAIILAILFFTPIGGFVKVIGGCLCVYLGFAAIKDGFAAYGQKNYQEFKSFIVGGIVFPGIGILLFAVLPGGNFGGGSSCTVSRYEGC